MCITEAPDTLCIQLLRFSGKFTKQQHHIQYQEQLTMDISLKNSNATSNEAAKVLYSLAGVVVHEGKSIQGGHYVSYVKKFGQWYRTDDVRVTKVSPFEATHQQAYLLFYQKVQNIENNVAKISNDPTGAMFGNSKDLNKCPRKENKPAPTTDHRKTEEKACNTKESTTERMSDNTTTTKEKFTEVPTHSKIIKRPVAIRALPPNYYVNDNQCPLPTKPRLVRSSEGARVSYKTVSDNEKEKVEILAQKGLNAKKHPRLAGWTPDDMLCLLPNQSGNGSWLSNFVINHSLLLLEGHAREIGNKVKTLNCDVLNNMTKPCKKLFVQNNYHTLP
jgi:hypothetical protein